MEVKFSIITPVYNGEKYIRRCIETVASCNYNLQEIEHIVVDDGSTDSTKQICLELSQKYKHLKFYSKPNGHWGSVINYAKNQKLATGDYIFVHDCDDLMGQNIFANINKKVNKLGFIPDIFAGSFCIWNGKKIKIKANSYYLLFRKLLTKKHKKQYFSPILLPFTTFVKKDIFYSLDDLKEHVPYQDNILYANSFIRSKTIGLTKKTCVYYWQNREDNTMSKINSEEGFNYQLNNLTYFSQNDLIEPFFYFLIGFPKMRKYLKSNKIQFNFVTKKPNTSAFPMAVRWILNIMFKIHVKKFVK